MNHSHTVEVSACVLMLAVSAGCGGAAPAKPAGQAAPAAASPKPEAQLQPILSSHEQEWAACVRVSAEQGVTIDKMRAALIAGDEKQMKALEAPMESAGTALRSCVEKKLAIVKELEATGAPRAAIDDAWKAFHLKLGGQPEASPSPGS